MFKIGDKVKFKKSSLDSGMIDSDESCSNKVIAVCSKGQWVKIYQNGWPVMYHPNHFEHVKEETMNTNEEQSINWEVGQEVWCLLRGKGQVNQVGDSTISVWFDKFGAWGYSKDGGFAVDSQYPRTLFFSEPKIEAELFPPKKPFTPTLKKGDTVVVKHVTFKEAYVLTVDYEEEDAVWFNNENDGYLKKSWNFHKIGEEIKFS